MSGGPETRPATSVLHRQAYSDKHSWNISHRLDTSKRSSPSLCFWRVEHPLTRSARCRQAGPEPAMSTDSQPRSLTSPAFLAPKGQAGVRNHNCTQPHLQCTQPQLQTYIKRRISSMSITTCRKQPAGYHRQFNPFSVVAGGHRNPRNPPLLRRRGSGRLGRACRIARHAATHRQAQSGRDRPGAPLFVPVIMRNRPSGRSRRIDTLGGAFKAVCPHRCWRQPRAADSCTESRARWA